MPTLECLDRRTGDCSGAVEYRMALSATGISYPRCDAHWATSLAQHDQHRKIYPDSPVPPAWFDPAAAGERWNDDD